MVLVRKLKAQRKLTEGSKASSANMGALQQLLFYNKHYQTAQVKEYG